MIRGMVLDSCYTSVRQVLQELAHKYVGKVPLVSTTPSRSPHFDALSSSPPHPPHRHPLALPHSILCPPQSSQNLQSPPHLRSDHARAQVPFASMVDKAVDLLREAVLQRAGFDLDAVNVIQVLHRPRHIVPRRNRFRTATRARNMLWCCGLYVLDSSGLRAARQSLRRRLALTGRKRVRSGPLQAARHCSSPVLFGHADDDQLVLASHTRNLSVPPRALPSLLLCFPCAASLVLLLCFSCSVCSCLQLSGPHVRALSHRLVVSPPGMILWRCVA